MKLVYDGHIRGTFKGWGNGIVYALQDNTKWKQARYHYAYHYAYNPSVKLWQDGSMYYLEVIGMSGMIEVKKTTDDPTY